MKRIKSGLFLIMTAILLLVGCESSGEITKTDTTVNASVNLSEKEAKEILNQVIPRALEMYGIFNGTGSFKIDKTNSIPGEEGYALVLDQNYKTVEDLRKAVEDRFTKDIAQKVFFSRYLTPEKDRPLYKDYEGKLYVDNNNGGHGWAKKFLLDTAKLKSQKDNIVEIEVDTTVLDDPSDKLTIKIEKIDGKWLLATRLD